MFIVYSQGVQMVYFELWGSPEVIKNSFKTAPKKIGKIGPETTVAPLHPCAPSSPALLHLLHPCTPAPALQGRGRGGVPGADPARADALLPVRAGVRTGDGARGRGARLGVRGQGGDSPHHRVRPGGRGWPAPPPLPRQGAPHQVH